VLTVKGGAGIAGNLNVGGNVVITGNLSITGNLTSVNYETVTNTEYVTTLVATTVNAATIGNASATFSGSSATLTGTVIAATVNAATIGNSGATLTGTLSTAAQTNITSVGTLTSLAVGTSLTVDNGSYGNVVATQFGSVFATAYGPNNYAILQAWSPATGGALGLNAYGNIVYSSGAINFKTSATIRDKDYPTGGTTGVQIAANGAVIASTGIASTSTGTGAVIVAGGVGISGDINIGGNITYGTVPVLESSRTVTGIGTAPVAIDWFSNISYRSAKYVVSTTDVTSSQYQTVEVILVQNGTTSTIASYGEVTSGASTRMTFTSNVMSGNVILWGTGVSANNTVKLARILIPT
jgi:hypothetical protein